MAILTFFRLKFETSSERPSWVTEFDHDSELVDILEDAWGMRNLAINVYLARGAPPSHEQAERIEWVLYAKW